MSSKNRIITVPAFSDNYIWLICDENQQYAAIVDPGDATPVIKALEKDKIQPVAILITHFHADHVGGIGKLLEKYPNLSVYGPASERIPHITHPLQGGETIHINQINTDFQVMNVHGHTAGHIAYYTHEDSADKTGEGRLFCGDTLFAAGCGRVFNGTKKDLHDSLEKISKLPENTLIYCAHEYTLDNIGFAKWVEPDNEKLISRESDAIALRENGETTVPSRLSLELETNPFLRTHLPKVVKRVSEFAGKPLENSTEVFTAMRTWKDTEYD
ncbi:hydroxyacylglutathione hydrolase [Cocleimonas flava]|uniref:Hydroxyacylglutathione hydrolase n=1 Tax=Cocleimonas flava TaxID=634765 RepID=A0A4R1ER68_9GAMM|nr:hydroxyacylglutathione hydrolase [Cocleimonas flava]TCJ82950.1 hydroxyacylglutathione hydrolase [Cocleimonas flava]